MNDQKRSAIAVAKEEAALARDVWIKALKALGESLDDENLDRADDARIAWQAAERKLNELKESASNKTPSAFGE